MTFTGEEDCFCEFCHKPVDRFHRVERWTGGRLHVFCFECDTKFNPKKGATGAETKGGGRIGKQMSLKTAASGNRATDPIQDAGGEGGGQPPLLKESEK